MSQPPQRTDTHDDTIAWIAAGTVLGLVAGALAAERLSGRPLTLRALLDRGRALASRAAARWEPLVDAAIGVRDAWEGNGAAAEEDEEVDEEELDDDWEDDDADDDAVDDDFDEDLDEDLDDGYEDDEEFEDEEEDDGEFEEEEEEGEDEEFEEERDEESADDSPVDSQDPGGATAIDARVLEAFTNDPVLAERDVEIEQAPDAAIILHGRVRTAREAAHAVTIARGVPGVASVRQRLTVQRRR